MAVNQVIQRINGRIIIHSGLHDKNGKLYNNKCSIKVKFAIVQDINLCSPHTYRVLETCECLPFYGRLQLRLIMILTANAIYIQLLTNDPEEMRIHCGGVQLRFI